MSDTADMRGLLERGSRSPGGLATDEGAVLLAGHVESLVPGTKERLSKLSSSVEHVRTIGAEQSPARLGEATLRVLESAKAAAPSGSSWQDNRAAAFPYCVGLDPPRFAIKSANEEARNTNGSVTRFTRANASNRTLEIAAATGEFGAERWPSSEAFVFGFNRSLASIGGLLFIPAHGAGAILTVSVQLSIEQLVYGGGILATSAASLLNTFRGDGDLPLRGTALGWARAGLSLHGADGSVRTAVDFVSEWRNRDGSDRDDLAPGGQINLDLTVALGPQTASLSVFVDIECFAGAEESEEPFRTGFAVFDCRDKPIGELNGTYIPPSRIRLSTVSARLCELPVLVADGRVGAGSA